MFGHFWWAVLLQTMVQFSKTFLLSCCMVPSIYQSSFSNCYCKLNYISYFSTFWCLKYFKEAMVAIVHMFYKIFNKNNWLMFACKCKSFSPIMENPFQSQFKDKILSNRSIVDNLLASKLVKCDDAGCI